MRRIDRSGHRYGRLVVIDPAGTQGNGQTRWNCRCDCGNATIAIGSNLASGNTSSCGCLGDESRHSHGTHHLSGTKLCRTWREMKRRCEDADNHAFASYGGRGVTICERWSRSVIDFATDVGEPPSPAHTLDRRDNDGPYSPENCFWATPTEQANNKRTNHRLTHDGETLTVAQWARRARLPYRTLYSRILRGWSVADAIETPLIDQHTAITYDGHTRTLREWADALGLPFNTLAYRVHAGWPLADAFSSGAIRRRDMNRALAERRWHGYRPSGAL